MIALKLCSINTWHSLERFLFINVLIKSCSADFLELSLEITVPSKSKFSFVFVAGISPVLKNG